MEWVSVDEAARITGMHKVSVYRMAARLEGTEHTRKEGRRRLLSRQYLEAQRAPLEAHKGPQTPPSPAYPPDYVARLEARIDAQERPPDPGMLTWLQQRIEAAEAERREIREQHTAELARVHAQLQQVHDQLAEALVEAQQLRHLLTGQQRLQLSREGVVRDADIQDLVLEVEPEPRSYSAWLRATRKAEF
jgi:hypothetical protein